MQKFTVFSILLSLFVLLAIGDIVYHNYLKGDDTVTTVTEDLLPIEDTAPTEEDGSTEVTPSTTPSTRPDESSVSLSEDTTDVLAPLVGLETFTEAGFLNPVLKDTSYSGLVFQFISFSDQTEATIYQSNLFDGEQYIGSIYEIRYPTETGSFQGYLALRERAMSLTDLGEINEVSNYGDAAFYFNHKTKIKTVHLVLRSGSSLYAFEYAQTYHEKMKKVFDIVSSPL